MRTVAKIILKDARIELEKVAADFYGTTDEPAKRQVLNDTADQICQTNVEEAELLGWITEEEAEQLRDRIHNIAAELHIHIMQIRIINKSRHPDPAYATAHSAGVDLRANLKEPVVLKPGQRVLIPTGIYLELPKGTEAQIRPRSGLAYKHGVTVLNSPGTIDADYRGEVGVLLINLGHKPFVINDGERIAQMVVTRYEHVTFTGAEDLSDTDRGDGGFGHTGTH